MRIVISLAAICFLILNLQSCNPAGPDNSLNITLEDVSCTEAWINVTGAVGSEMLLKRDDKEVKRFTLTSSPQILYDDSLMPNKNYSYQVLRAGYQETSSRLSVVTLDTTSNNYTWQTFIFGGAASSYLSDAAIVNDTSIWAAGAVYVNDSTGQVDPVPYNAIHWNGITWKLFKIESIICGNNIPIISPLRSLFPFSNTNISYSDGAEIITWKDSYYSQDCSINTLLAGAINKIWGKSEDYFFIVGNNGTVAHYANSNWQKIETGIETDISDIWGKEDMVLFTGYHEIYEIKNNSTVEKIEIPLNRIIRSVWFDSKNKIYAAGDGIFSSIDMKNWKQENLSDEFATFRIRGTGKNNIWSTGGFGFTAHFNGVRWYTITENQLQSGNYYSLAVNENLVVLVGSNGRSTLITIGRK